MTLEIIIFVLATLFGIVIAYRESKNNTLYRFFNKLFHSKELQMKPDNPKGFVYGQHFLMRVVWIIVGYIVVSGILSFVTPINIIYIQHFASAVVGTLLGTYLTTMFFATSEGLSKENVMKQAKEVYEKGKDLVEDLTDDKEDVVKEASTETTPKKEIAKEEPEVKKSVRDRLKDKGMIK